MASGIEVRVLGDYGPFSEQGKSIGYLLMVGGDEYLIDLGASPFQLIGHAGIARLKGVLITHCHDDHKRWFSDLALYHMYAPSLRRRLRLITRDTVAEELRRASGPALERSLDAQSSRVVDIAWEDYVEHVPVGPRALYRLVCEDRAQGNRWSVQDSTGRVVGPERAKVVLSGRTGRPRMLFCDPESGEWVEPETYYSLYSPVFHEADPRVLEGDGYRIRILDAPVWHGLPNFAVVVETASDRLIFSSDTYHNQPLWQRLAHERRTPKADLSSPEFLDAEVLHGDINDYVERIWSPKRYEEAMHAFTGAAVIHDISGRFGVVHTEYHALAETSLDPRHTLLTHAPDRFTAVGWVLMRAGKRYRVEGDCFQEVTEDDRAWPLDADVYHKQDGRFFAGYRHAEGRFYVYAKDGYPSVRDGTDGAAGELLFRVNLFEDVNGRYLPHPGESGAFYITRPDGGVERVHRDGQGSHGRLTEDLRSRRHTIEPDALARLGERRATGSGEVALEAELRELKRTLAAMRDTLEQQAHDHAGETQRALAGAQAEIVELRATAAALREAIEQERVGREAAVNEAVRQANAEIVQLRVTAAALRDEMERREVEAGNLRQAEARAAQQELNQLRATIQALRDQLDAIGPH